MNALSNVFAADGLAPLFLCAVKSNIGHLEAAAGMAGLIKALGCLQHRSVATNLLHGAKLNEYLKPSLQTTPMLVPTSEEAELELTLTAGVSSFGFGGTNAHCVLRASPLCSRHLASVLSWSRAVFFWFTPKEPLRHATSAVGEIAAYRIRWEPHCPSKRCWNLATEVVSINTTAVSVVRASSTVHVI